MGVFTNNIVVEIFPKTEFPYNIFREFEFHSGRPDSGLFVRCEVGFRFNGTSIPWAFRWVISPSDPSLLQCAGGHDKIFRTGMLIERVSGVETERPATRKEANLMMLEMMVARKVRRWKRFVVNTGLIFSGPSWREWEQVRADQSTATDTTK